MKMESVPIAVSTFDNSTASSSVEHYVEAPGAPYIHPAIFWAKIISFAVIIILTIVGNSIVVIIILRNKHMRTATYYYLMNLAVADIAIAIFSEWIWLHNHLLGSWVFGEVICKFSTYFQGVSVHVSILTLTVVAGDRYFAILYPLKSRVIKRNAGVVIAIVWAIAILINIPLVLHVRYITHKWSDGVFQAWCMEFWDDDNDNVEDEKKKHYSFSMFVLVYIIPLMIMLLAYLRIALTLGARTTSGPGVNVESTLSAQERARRKVIKMLIIVVSTFALCWLPYHIMILYKDWNPHAGESKNAFFVCLWLGYSNSAMNPFIYCGFNENFRRGFKLAFTCQLFKKKQCMVKPNSKSVCSTHTDGTVLESML